MSGNYLLARGVINGEYVDLGIEGTPNKVLFNQVHTIYNGTVSPSTKKMCQAWIYDHAEDLQNILKALRNNKHESLSVLPNPWENDDIEDIPF
jgi:hypothetical protein